MNTTNLKYKSIDRLQLQELYEVNYKTFRLWLRSVPNLNVRYVRVFNPKQVKKIFDHLGEPDGWDEFCQ